MGENCVKDTTEEEHYRHQCIFRGLKNVYTPPCNCVIDFLPWQSSLSGAKTINVFRACLGAQLAICAQKWRSFVLLSTVSLRFVSSRVCVFLYSLGPWYHPPDCPTILKLPIFLLPCTFLKCFERWSGVRLLGECPRSREELLSHFLVMEYLRFQR